jgi:hypothetical protein
MLSSLLRGGRGDRRPEEFGELEEKTLNIKLF